MAIKKNKVSIELASYLHYWRGVKKSGKTTLFRDLVRFVYGSEDGGLLLSFADEEGYKSLDALQYEEIKTWTKKEDSEGNRGFIQVVDDLVKNRTTDYKEIKVIAYDTFDKLLEVGTDRVLKEHFLEKGEKCKSLNDAFGGYGRGKDRLRSMIQEQTARLRDAGYGIIVIGHTKFKDKKDKVADVEYEQVTSSLNQDLDAIFGDTAHIVMTITVDPIVEDGKLLGSNRVMHFRDTNGTVDCGGRFANIPETMPLGAENYMSAFKEGVKGQFLNPKTEKEIEEMKKVELEERERLASQYVEEQSEDKQQLLDSLVSKYKEGTQEQKDTAKGKLVEFKIPDFKDADNFSVEQLKVMIEVFN